MITYQQLEEDGSLVRIQGEFEPGDVVMLDDNPQLRVVDDKDVGANWGSPIEYIIYHLQGDGDEEWYGDWSLKLVHDRNEVLTCTAA